MAAAGRAGTAASVERVRGDVIEQRALDRYRDVRGGIKSKTAMQPSPDLLHARMRATIEALAQPDEPYAARQSLIDLAAIAQEIAAALPRPERQPPVAA